LPRAFGQQPVRGGQLGVPDLGAGEPDAHAGRHVAAPGQAPRAAPHAQERDGAGGSGRMMKVLVLGGTGYIGSRLCALLASSGWYGRAKGEAEDILAGYEGGTVRVRPGCVGGAGSELWVGCVGRLLKSGRLGDLGAAGDGWSDLVAVDDVCTAIIASLRIAV